MAEKIRPNWAVGTYETQKEMEGCEPWFKAKVDPVLSELQRGPNPNVERIDRAIVFRNNDGTTYRLVIRFGPSWQPTGYYEIYDPKPPESEPKPFTMKFFDKLLRQKVRAHLTTIENSGDIGRLTLGNFLPRVALPR